jgi:restriction system protein
MTRCYVVRIGSDTEKYVENNIVAIGWSKIDLAANPNNVEELMHQKYFNEMPNAINLGIDIAQTKRFLNINTDDIILVPCYRGFYMGRSTGNFFYSEKDVPDDLSNQLSVTFLRDKDRKARYFTRDYRSTALSTKLGVRRFTILEYNDVDVVNEIIQLYSNDEDSSFAQNVEKVEKDSYHVFRNQLKRSLQNYSKIGLKAKGRGFEELIKSLFCAAGYETELLSKRVGGCSIADADIKAIKKSILSPEFDEVIYIQAKHHTGSTGLVGMKQLISFRKQNEERDESSSFAKYVLITSAQFSPDVLAEAHTNGIIVVDGDHLCELLFDHIDDLDASIRYSLGFAKQYIFTK